jgi:uncharacterized protein (DUF169 family)
METLAKLEKAFGGRWHGVTLMDQQPNQEESPAYTPVARFCEAVMRASVDNVLLDPDQFTCPGARYAFGCGMDLKEDMQQKLINEKGYTSDYVARLLDETPHCKTTPAVIGINTGHVPDVVIAQLQPEQTMRLLQMYQKKLNKTFQSTISSVISACGNVVVKAFQTEDMAMSFGCIDSRSFGGLSRDRLFVGLPYSLAAEIVQL